MLVVERMGLPRDNQSMRRVGRAHPDCRATIFYRSVQPAPACEQVLTDRSLFVVDSKTYAKFVAALDSPPAAGKKLHLTMQATAPWERKCPLLRLSYLTTAINSMPSIAVVRRWKSGSSDGRAATRRTARYIATWQPKAPTSSDTKPWPGARVRRPPQRGQNLVRRWPDLAPAIDEVGERSDARQHHDQQGSTGRKPERIDVEQKQDDGQ